MNAATRLTTESVSAATNILLFSFIPLVWHLIRRRTLQGFAQSLGLYRTRKDLNLFTVFLIIAPAYLATLAANIALIVLGYSGRSPADTQGLTAVTLFLSLLLYGLKTGIAEEIFFRGFLARKLIGVLGFSRGNVIQAAVFALPHVVLSGSASTADIVVRVLNAFLLGYVFGYVMDRKCDGSIVPVMIAHTAINMVSSLVLSMVL